MIEKNIVIDHNRRNIKRKIHVVQNEILGRSIVSTGHKGSWRLT